MTGITNLREKYLYQIYALIKELRKEYHYSKCKELYAMDFEKTWLNWIDILKKGQDESIKNEQDVEKLEKEILRRLNQFFPYCNRNYPTTTEEPGKAMLAQKWLRQELDSVTYRDSYHQKFNALKANGLEKIRVVRKSLLQEMLLKENEGKLINKQLESDKTFQRWYTVLSAEPPLHDNYQQAILNLSQFAQLLENSYASITKKRKASSCLEEKDNSKIKIKM